MKLQIWENDGLKSFVFSAESSGAVVRLEEVGGDEMQISLAARDDEGKVRIESKFFKWPKREAVEAAIESGTFSELEEEMDWRDMINRDSEGKVRINSNTSNLVIEALAGQCSRGTEMPGWRLALKMIRDDEKIRDVFREWLRRVDQVSITYNARLIAASPDLLHAAKFALKEIDEMISGLDGVADEETIAIREGWMIVAEHLRSAISRAETGHGQPLTGPKSEGK